MTEAELASQTDTFVRESLEDLLYTMRHDRRGYGARGSDAGFRGRLSPFLSVPIPLDGADEASPAKR